MARKVSLFLSMQLIFLIQCQMPKKPPIIPLVNDIPFIQCEVCQKAIKAVFKSVREKREEIKPLKLGEDDILSMVEGTCDPDSDYGKWIRHYDIIEKDNSLKLQEHKNKGKCREECKTIARSCEQTIGDIDTDISEILWQNELKLSPLINKVCHKTSTVCSKKPKYKAGSRKDFKFMEMTEKDIEAEKMMSKMKGMPGMPGLEMYDPEDLKNMREDMGIDDKMIEEYKKKQQQQSPGREDEQQGQSSQKQQEDPYQYQSNMGFFDTVKAAGKDIYGKMKSVFGYGDKSEL